VALGPKFGTDWVVNSGVSPGALVIIYNLKKLRDGAPVNPHQATKANTPATSVAATVAAR
jgi:membrane fusion protein (multidrug efflux system)